MQPTIDVSVVSHAQWELARRLIEDLRARCGGQVGRILLTLNMPEDVDAAFIARNEVEVLRNARPLGFASNHNQAAVHLRAPLLAILNPDLRLRENPFPPLTAELLREGVGMVAPVIVEPDGRRADSVRRLLTPMDLASRYVLDRAGGDGRGDAWVAGMFMLFRSTTFARLGGFDERFRLYCEDFDICARLRLSGEEFKVVEGVTVEHAARRASHRSLRPLVWHVSSLARTWTSPVFWRYRSWLRQRA